MRAAILRRHGSPPEFGRRPAPRRGPGEALIRVTAAPASPLDLLCASGTSYFGAPALPYVPGTQGVGVIEDADGIVAGQRVWFSASAGMRPGDGSMAEWCVVLQSAVLPVTDGVSGAVHVCGGRQCRGGAAGRSPRSADQVLTFVLSGGAAALGGLIDTSRVLSAQASNGETTLTFTVLAGIVVGGTSILGGEGGVWRTVVGVLFIALIGNGSDLLGLNPLYDQIILGVILLVAVGTDAWSRQRMT